MARAEHMLPEMWKSARGTLGIDSDLLFHKGAIQLSRKTGNRFLEIDQLVLFVSLCWTCRKSEISPGNAIRIDSAFRVCDYGRIDPELGTIESFSNRLEVTPSREKIDENRGTMGALAPIVRREIIGPTQNRNRANPPTEIDKG